jgi:hypothetical protein
MQIANAVATVQILRPHENAALTAPELELHPNRLPGFPAGSGRSMGYTAAPDRYEGKMQYRRCGRSGLDLPLLSLGYWHHFGDERPFEVQRAIARRAFALGITHHDLANNYGPPYGSAELSFGRLMGEDFAAYRDEMIVSTKAGGDIWPRPSSASA